MQEDTPILGWENRRKRLWLLKFRSLKSCKLDLSMGGNLSASPGISVHGRRVPVWGAWGPQVWVHGILRPPTSEEGHLLPGGTSLAPWILEKLLTLEGTAMARERAGGQWQEGRPGRVDGGYKNLFWIQNDCFCTQLRYLLTLWKFLKLWASYLTSNSLSFPVHKMELAFFISYFLPEDSQWQSM